VLSALTYFGELALLMKETFVSVFRAPTEAVVIASLTIIAANFILTFALNIVFPAL
jgi:ABC-type transporter Mla maintaining outer membrane lipid asymmetry permease subunit MlaE